jgi:tetratricopeptide (TPR) repeat protein
MNTLKSLTIAAATTLVFTVSPASYAQDDLQRMQLFLDIMGDYMQIIESTHAINSDAEKAAIMQMQKIKEIYEERGEKAKVADTLREVLAGSQNQAIRNSAYMILGNTLKETGRSDEAIKLMRDALKENIRAAQ